MDKPPAYNPSNDELYHAGYDQGYPMQATASAGPRAPIPAVMTQPQSQQMSNNTVIIQQPAATSQPTVRNWHTGVCGCFEDMPICCCGWFCTLCLMCQVSQDLGESACVPCCVPNALLALRLKWRLKQNIQGDIMNDHHVTCCCGPCALCQLAREIKIKKNIDLARV